MTQLVLNIKQGEDLNVPFTIKQDGTVTNLTGATIRFLVKKVPLDSAEAIVSKTITETSDTETIGQITNAIGGQFEVRLLPEDTLFPPNDYYLIIFMDINGNSDIISSTANGSAIYRVCTQ